MSRQNCGAEVNFLEIFQGFNERKGEAAGEVVNGGEFQQVKNIKPERGVGVTTLVSPC
jgi:hypothetical protein